MDRKRVGIVVFDNVEVLDFCGPFEVFSTTRLDEASRLHEPSPFEVLLVAEHNGTILTAGYYGDMIRNTRILKGVGGDDAGHPDMTTILHSMVITLSRHRNAA